MVIFNTFVLIIDLDIESVKLNSRVLYLHYGRVVSVKSLRKIMSSYILKPLKLDIGFETKKLYG